MCKVKTGADVYDLQDVQNLVTGIVFRQTIGFRRDDLLSAVRKYMQGSPVEHQHYKIEYIVDSTLSTCVYNNWLTCRRDTYVPTKLF